MSWILILSVMINTTPYTMKVHSFNEWMCNIVADKIQEKTITLNGDILQIKTVKCSSS